MNEEREGTFEGTETDLDPLLRAVLDTLVPPSPDGRFPGAGELGCGSTVMAACTRMPGLAELVHRGLQELDRASQAAHGKHFAELDAASREQLLGEQSFVFPLVIQVYIAYYQHPRVLAALGLDPRPPHPGGYELREP